MRTLKLAAVAFTLIVLASTTSAMATPTCAPPVDEGSGVVSILITAEAGNTINALVIDPPVGGVTVAEDCMPGSVTCTVTGTGIPGGATPQSVTFRATDTAGGGSIECMMTDMDGLPVELVDFSVD